MSTLRISLEPHAAGDLRQHVRDHLDTFNVAVTGLHEYHSVSVFLRDEHDEVLGGCLGEIWGGWLSVNFLWVAEALRGQGHGQRLLAAAERYAVAGVASRLTFGTMLSSAERRQRGVHAATDRDLTSGLRARLGANVPTAE